jgi:hypothetical protein
MPSTGPSVLVWEPPGVLRSGNARTHECQGRRLAQSRRADPTAMGGTAADVVALVDK